MTRSKDLFTGSRRKFMRGASATFALAAAGLSAPKIARAAGAVKIGLIHPATGWAAYPAAQLRYGAQMAIADINAAGGIKSMGGAALEAVLGDSQTKPEIGAAEVEKMNEAGVHAIQGCYQSAVGLAASAAAAKYNIPFSVDVGVSDKLVQRGLSNVFRMADGYGRIAADASVNLAEINKAAGSPAKTVAIVHEESEFGTGTAKLVTKALASHGLEVIETIKHANPTRNFDNIALRLKSAKPDIIMPINYPGEYILLAKTLRQQRVDFMASYSVLGGGFNFKFVDEMPQIAENMIDVNHWYDPRSTSGQEMRARTEADGKYFTFEVYCAYMSIMFLADGFERAGSTDKEAVNAALASSTLDIDFMPYGPTKMVDGQNMGSRAVAIQAQKGDVQIIAPSDYASASAVFPRS
ncbi:MAG: ABC transporter substrate-binding protein [Paracoccaceae bacterium]|jgi:branched-chain amino acid transport system substrate-binding protein|nr:ABC transporter substrate-binding protein [Rhodobacterales bacterium FZCC0083]